MRWVCLRVRSGGKGGRDGERSPFFGGEAWATFRRWKHGREERMVAVDILVEKGGEVWNVLSFL